MREVTAVPHFAAGDVGGVLTVKWSLMEVEQSSSVPSTQLNSKIQNELRQARISQLASAQMHRRRKRGVAATLLATDILTIVVPVLYFAPKLLVKSPAAAELVGQVDTVFSVLLLALGVLRFVVGWDARMRGHEAGLDAGMRTARRAWSMLTDPATTDAAARAFLDAANEPRADDKYIEHFNERERQEVYRQALREYEPGASDTRCPKCNASVWEFKPGTCDMCGNTPDSKSESHNEQKERNNGERG